MSINRNETILGITGLQKYYGKNHVLKGIDLNIHRGEVVAIIGQSGSGKSTLLRCMNGLEEYQEGQIIYNGELTITSDPAEAQEISRSIGMIFQQFNLFPHLTAIQNVMLAPQLVLGLSIMESHILAEQMLIKVGLGDRCDFYPSGLSGGQQQRVAIARSLVNQPRVLLLDEPLGALDLKLRKEMQLELKRLQREMNITFVYVTHDQEEALTMSDTVVVMSGGKIQQIGSPQDIYNEPKNAFVARFIGDSNIVDGVMLKDFLVNFGGHDFTCVDRGFKVNEPVQVVIRPEDVQIVPPSVGMLTGLVREVIFKGVHFEMHVDVEGYEWIIHSTQASQPGELIGMNIGPDEIHIMKRSEV